MNLEKRKLKFVLVGDSCVGKNYVCSSFIGEEFSIDKPAPFEYRSGSIKVDDIDYELEIWVPSGQTDFDRLRPLSYSNTDCIIICYSAVNRGSFENVTRRWIPEVKFYCANVPVILVATQIDRCKSDDPAFVTEAEGIQVALNIEARGFVECSAFKNINVNKVFETAVKKATKPKKQNKGCKVA